MSYKVFKKGKKYAIVTEEQYWSKKYWLVDVTTGQKLDYWYDTSTPKWYMEDLENGSMSPSYFSTSYGEMDASDMPKSLQVMQKKLQSPSSPKPAPKVGKPKAKVSAPTAGQVWGATVTKDHGTFQTMRMADGTYGWIAPDGTSMSGYKSPSGATLAGKKFIEDRMKVRAAELGVDPGGNATQALMGHYRDRVGAIYSQAVGEMRDKLDSQMRKYEEDRQAWEARVASGKATQEAFDSWLGEQARQQGRMMDMTDQLAQALTDADSHAMAVLNGYLPSAYAENFNYATYQVESGTGVATSFALYDSPTVARLLSQDPKLLPERKTDEGKDLAWNRRKVTEAVTQGILQGESVDKVAARLQQVAGMDERAALRAARTALTGAQNAGRVDAYARASALGIDVEQEWQATYDQRTRHSHAALDGERVGVGETFSNGLRYPGDPDGPPAEVYNCRCTLVPVVKGHDDGGDWKKGVTIDGMPYDEWKQWHADQVAPNPDKIKADLSDAKAKLAEVKAKMPDDKDFGSIVQGGGKASQWSPEKVASSEDFYFNKLKNAIAHGNQFDIDWYKKRLAELKEYDDAGRAYHDAYERYGPQLSKLQSKVDDLTAKWMEALKSGGVGAAYSQDRLDAAHYWSDKRDADRVMRPLSSGAWLASNRGERHAAYHYTDNYFEHYNRPLNGFSGSYRNYVGYGMVDVDREGEGENIRRLTRVVERSVTGEDMWLRRGTDRHEMDSFFGFPAQDVFGGMSDEELQGLVGVSGRVGSFLSCGTAPGSGAGFGGEVNLEIFVPAGSQALYCEPFSAFGGGYGESWDGTSGQSYFGGEFETLLQRGGSYTCIGIERRGYGWTVRWELHPEDGYDLFQQ